MKTKDFCGTIYVTAGMEAKCPECGKIVQETRADTTASNLPVFCRRCHRLYELNIAAPAPESLSR